MLAVGAGALKGGNRTMAGLTGASCLRNMGADMRNSMLHTGHYYHHRESGGR